MRNKIEALQARKENGGFTLVELLIVIVILGILAGIAVFGVTSFRGSAEVAACKATANTITSAAQAFKAAEKTTTNASGFPTDVAELVSTGFLANTPNMGTATPSLVTYTNTTGIAKCA